MYTVNPLGGYIQFIYWRLTWPYMSISFSSVELEIWTGSYYFRALWRSPETNKVKLWGAVGKRGEQAKFNGVEQAKFQRVK